MTSFCSPEAVFVEAAARLHFGVLDLRGALGRWFGGIGAAAPAPTLLVSACAGRHAGGRGRRMPIARPALPRRFLAASGIERGARVAGASRAAARTRGSVPAPSSRSPWRVRSRSSTAPAADAPALARAVGRAQRSAIGTWTFAGGGLVVEGGRRRDATQVAPLLARLPFPPTWRCVVAVPSSAPRNERSRGSTRRSRSCRRRPSATSSASRISC